jgi:type I restriction enzyme S subunit
MAGWRAPRHSGLLPALFVKIFGERFHQGSRHRFGALITITGGGTPSRDNPKYFEGKTPWLTAKDMRGEFIWDTQEHIAADAIENSATKLVPANSILVVVKSKVLMNRLPVAIAKVPMCHGQDIKSIQCGDHIHYQFARFVLKFYEHHLLQMARGANTEGLTLPTLEGLLVPDVSLKEQSEFASLVNEVEHLRATHVEALRQADHLFRGLLHQAFSLTVPRAARASSGNG